MSVETRLQLGESVLYYASTMEVSGLELGLELGLSGWQGMPLHTEPSHSPLSLSVKMTHSGHN